MNFLSRTRLVEYFTGIFLLLISPYVLSGNYYFPSPSGNQTEDTCGSTVDWKAVESYKGGKWPSAGFVNVNDSAVARLLIKSSSNAGTGLCTGTMISPDLFLTAGHCVDGNSTYQVQFNYQTLSNGASKPSEIFKVSGVVEDKNGNLDYAILRVQGKPGLKYGMNTPALGNITSGTQLAIIQHPNGIQKVIDAGSARSLSGSQLYYGNIDTAGGSSGSGVLDNSGNIVAVHTNGGCVSHGGNSGVMIRNIAQVSPVVSQLTSRVCHMQPVARYWDSNAKDHYYDTVFEPLGIFGYKFERYEFSVCKNNISGSVALHRWWNPAIADHLLTVDNSSGSRYYLQSLGYKYERIMGRVHTSSLNQSVPLREYNNINTDDHFYTIDNMANGTYGYSYIGISGYVYQQR